MIDFIERFSKVHGTQVNSTATINIDFYEITTSRLSFTPYTFVLFLLASSSPSFWHLHPFFPLLNPAARFGDCSVLPQTSKLKTINALQRF